MMQPIRAECARLWISLHNYVETEAVMLTVAGYTQLIERSKYTFPVVLYHWSLLPVSTHNLNCMYCTPCNLVYESECVFLYSCILAVAADNFTVSIVDTGGSRKVQRSHQQVY